MDDAVPPMPGEPASEEHEETKDDLPPLPSLPPEVATGDDEVRRLIEAGASTPEELHDLAARIRANRDREEALWRDEVRPALKEAKKGRFRLGDLIDRPEDSSTNHLAYGVGILAVTVVLMLAAAQSSIIWVLLPLVAVLVYAYLQGRQGDAPTEARPTDEDAAD